jgi:hypothetical protein
VEVYRTDGTWSAASVTEFDDGSFTYTIQLEDGRLKYCVVRAALSTPELTSPSTACQPMFKLARSIF